MGEPVGELTPKEVIAYLEAHGWTRIDGNSRVWTQMRHTDGVIERHVWVPLGMYYADYEACLYRVLSAAFDAEGRDPPQTKAELMAEAIREAVRRG